jgi:hypothetical protein
MAETIGTRSQTIVIKGYNPAYIVERRINGADIKPGHVVTGYGEANQNDVDLCAAGEPALGIALEHYMDDGLAGTVRDTPDIDTLYTDNATVRVALIGSGMTCLSFLGGQTTTTAVYAGSELYAKSSGVLQLSTFVSTTAQLAADLVGRVGKSIEYDAGGSLDKVIAIVI